MLLVLLSLGTHHLLVSSEDSHVDLSSIWQDSMVADERAWLVEFYSPMCGSCKEFAPIFRKIATAVGNNVAIGTVNIDTKEGMKIAQSLGVLDEGLPNVRLFHSLGEANRGTSILKDFTTASKALAEKLIKKVNGNLKKLPRRDDGFHVKV